MESELSANAKVEWRMAPILSHKKRTKDCSLVLRLYASFPRLYDTTYLGAIELNTQDDSHHHYHPPPPPPPPPPQPQPQPQPQPSTTTTHNHHDHHSHNHNHHHHHHHHHNHHNHHNHHHNNNHSNRSNHSNHSNRSNDDDDDDDDDDNSNNNHNQPRRTINDSKICLQTQKHFLELWDHVKGLQQAEIAGPKAGSMNLNAVEARLGSLFFRFESADIISICSSCGTTVGLIISYIVLPV